MPALERWNVAPLRGWRSRAIIGSARDRHRSVPSEPTMSTPQHLAPRALATILLVTAALAGQVRLAPATSATGFAHLPGRVLFFATTPTTGREPWVTDGTVAGTAMLIDLNPGTRSSFVAVGPSLGDRVIFLAFTNALFDTALFATDGTPGGTRLLVGLGGGSHLASRMVRFDGRVWYLDHFQLSHTDGTVAGTGAIELPSRALAGLAATADKLFYVLTNPLASAELWCVDAGLRTPRLVLSLPPGRWIDDHLEAANNRAFFLVSAVNPQRTELWSSDGTTGGTQMALATDVLPGTMLPARGRLLVARHASAAAYSLTSSDGTRSGTQDVLSASLPLDARLEPFAVTEELAVYRYGSTTGNELWSSDGSAPGTARLAINGIPQAAVAAAARRQLIFTAPDLWVTDGTPGGTRPVVPGVSATGGIAAWDLAGGPTVIFDRAGPVAMPLSAFDTADVVKTRTGCAGVFRPVPVLDRGAEVPRLGAAFALRLTGVAANAIAAVVVGGALAPTDACGIAIGSVITAIPLFADWNGIAVLGLQVPRDRALLGGFFHAQSLVVASNGAILGVVDASNAATTLIGR